ncbi:immunity 49 family protein [Streptomyces sp. NPDC048410]|uniref:immunity 49 family protein n=1 Tax=Streptomyces sp. NPDC048410 TaxID=3365545 RepID=UPI0037123361
MTETIHRHRRTGTVDEARLGAMTERLRRRARTLGTSGTSFALALSESRTVLTARLVVDPLASGMLTWDAAVTALQFSQGAFAAAGRSGGTVECRVMDEPRSVTATGPRFYTDATNWLYAFWLAVICRDQARVTRLCEVPPEVLRTTEVRADEYLYDWTDTLRAYGLRQPGLVEKLGRTIRGASLDVPVVAPRNLLRDVLFPPIALFRQFLREDHDAFNTALREALHLHRAYWSADEQRADDFDGVVSFGLLAVTCLAHDAGFPVDVESEYLPEHLLKGSWVGMYEI